MKMFRFCPIATLLLLLTLLLVISTNNLRAAVIVTGPTNGNCLNVSPGSFTVLTNILITEGSKNDFPTQAGTTLILTAPAGFEFNPGVGTITGQQPMASGNITALSITVTSSTISIVMSVSGTNKWDEIIISGIEARALSYGASGNLYRISGSGGTATIVGDAAGAGVSHGYFASPSSLSVWSVADGNWSNPAIWSGGVVPSCRDSVFIYHNVVANTAVSAKNLIIGTNGNLRSDFAVTVDMSLHLQNNGIYNHNNASNASTTIFKGTEYLSATSTIIIQQWYSTAVPLPQNISGNFGNVTFSYAATWSQDGLFAPAKIQGTLTVTSGAITMDDGTGMTTALTLNDVVVTGTGALIMASGTNRNLTLVTGAYTDASTSGTKSIHLKNCQGNLTWTANGNVNISHHFSGYQHSGSNPGNTLIQINGDLTISGGQFAFNSLVDAPLDLTVTGTTTFSGSPTYIRFIDSNSGSLNFTTANLIISGGNTTELSIAGNATSNVAISVTNDLTVSGASTYAIFFNNSSSTAGLNLDIGRDLVLTAGNLEWAYTNGTVSVDVGRNLSISGTGSVINGQTYASTTADLDLFVGGYFEIDDGGCSLSEGLGDVYADVVEDVFHSNATFYGINNSTTPGAGSLTLNCENLNFNGGTMVLYNAISNSAKTVEVNVNTDLNVTFRASTDICALIGLAGSNDALLDLNIAGNFVVTGNYANAWFLSSTSTGMEDIQIGGTLMVTGGNVFFVGKESGLTNNHNITTAIDGDIDIQGGNTRLSTGSGSAVITVGGNLSISIGTLTLKHKTGSGQLTVTGNYTQSGGTFNIHTQNAAVTDVSTVTVNDDFIMTGGTFNFDNRQAATDLAEHILYINGSHYTLDGSAIITHANDLTTNFIFGHIYFSKTGTTVYKRNTSTNEIRHVKYMINSGTTVNATLSSEGFQMTSVGTSSQTYNICLNVYGTLDMGDQVLSARQYTGYYARVTVRNNGRYRTSHSGGLYSGDISRSSSINGYMFGSNRVAYNLEANSIVEYYGAATTMITGIPNGVANGTSQKYGFLEINFTGTAGSTWVYPETSGEVFIRSGLILTAGEFNLDDDHVTDTGGREITVESGATITRTSGFIRSETEDGSGKVLWDIASNGTYVIPFGYDASNYIPVTYQQTSGTTGMLESSTYRSAADNQPYPPSVTHVRDVNGVDNSAYTVDRFWFIYAPGAATSSITCSVVASESSGILSPRAQLWEPGTQGWFPPAGTQSNPTGTTTQAAGLTSFSGWWTLAAASNPLPVELIRFDVIRQSDKVSLHWTTATEINNDYFTVERSADGLQFSELSVIDGAGNSVTPIDYVIDDLHPLKGINYYRLKQTDFDGNFSYSPVKTVVFNDHQEWALYPNPATNSDFVELVLPVEDHYRIYVTDLSGRNVSEHQIDASDRLSVKLPVREYFKKEGIYMMTISGNTNHWSTKVIIR